MNRRLILSLVGIGAAGAGAYWSQQHRSSSNSSPVATSASDPVVASTSPAATMASGAAAAEPVVVADDLWGHRFDRPEGGEQLIMSAYKGKPLVVNFWATWCPPCVKEMPELDRFAKEFAAKGWQVVGIAADSKTPVNEFLKKTPVSFPIGLAGFAGTELARALGNPGGGLPFSVLMDAYGQVAQRKLGATTFDELKAWVV